MTAIIIALAIPLVLLNTIGGFVAIGWLLFLGDWKPVLAGIVTLIFAPLPLGLITLPGGLVFGMPAITLIEKGRTLLAFPLIILNQGYLFLVISVWCGLVFLASLKFIHSGNLWPMLIWSYSVAVGPWTYLAQKEAQSGGGQHEAMTLFFTGVSYVLSAIVWGLYRPHLYDLAALFGILMSIGALLESIAVVSMARAVYTSRCK